MAEFTSGASWSDPSRDPLAELQRAKELVEKKYDQGLEPEYEPIPPGILQRVRAWFSSRLRAFDESHLLDLGDADDPDVRVVIGFDGARDDEVPPVRYVLGVAPAPAAPLPEWRKRFRANLLANPGPAAVSCAFCQERATEEIFVGWANPPGGLVSPPTAQFARVCIDHVGHSRFTRSDRPVDEL
ncbi:MAG TPA: hypothetical protein VIP28_05930 [Nocardioides sp.]